MQGNIGFVKNERSNRLSRQSVDAVKLKPKYGGKTWQRKDKRQQWGE